ncbi:MAG: bifunctional diaminohydroxyphosphoribosylaminopyrimidine deaminase/5-amino-6-(5-phosphoribosylamino)uracil reductase RibD [Frankiaceae bacterium]|nr:bifunctional diaminohydroxyphosphoribosylaminopyrimidine deaminase/5-amino-6-(5-phosphoribosylamino)uracil reductase RibD [Frankiaceae bacterium]
MATDAELAAMRRAIEISSAVRGTTNPNPTVGAVIISRAGAVVGEGVTQPIGGNHAEIEALRVAGDAATDATLVVTLEPCRHSGRTRRCTDAILAAGVSRVVYALDDPHDIAAGGAVDLARAGVDVEAGVLATEAELVLGPWTSAMARRRPHVTWKYAATLDGRVAAADGSSRWITGPAARRDVHRERFYADAVIAGIGTVLADDPQLTVRHWAASRQPLRVVIDSDARTPVEAQVVDPAAPTLIVVAEDAPAARVAALGAAGAEVVGVPRAAGGVDLAAALATLWEREVALGFLEGGPTLAAAFLRAELIDRVVGYHAPVLLGAGAAVLGDVGIATLDDAGRFRFDDVTQIGDDLRVVARITPGSQ